MSSNNDVQMRRKCGEKVVQAKCSVSTNAVQMRYKCGTNAVQTKCSVSADDVQKSVIKVVEMPSETRRVPYLITDGTQEHLSGGM